MGSVIHIRLVAKLRDGVVLLIEENPDGVFLYDCAQDGSGSDTWHRTIQDAKAQAEYQFGWSPEDWANVPAETADPIKFAREISN
jgi:hypothetical protein